MLSQWVAGMRYSTPFERTNTKSSSMRMSDLEQGKDPCNRLSPEFSIYLMAQSGIVIWLVPESGVIVHFFYNLLVGPHKLRLLLPRRTSISSIAKKTGWVTSCQWRDSGTKRDSS